MATITVVVPVTLAVLGDDHRRGGARGGPVATITVVVPVTLAVLGVGAGSNMLSFSRFQNADGFASALA